METIILSVIAICCLCIAYTCLNKLRKETTKTEDIAKKTAKESLFCKSDAQVFIEGIEYEQGIAKIQKTIPEHYVEQDHVTYINIPLDSIKIWWTKEKEPYTPALFAPGLCDPFHGEMSLFLSVDGKVYELIHDNYTKMKKIVEEFKSKKIPSSN